MNELLISFALISILSLINSTLLFCLNMWNVFNWYIAHRPKWMNWLKHCFFCYGFRFAVYECLVIAILFFQSWHLLYVPFACASLTFLITISKNENN
jgi:hypothetical protein